MKRAMRVENSVVVEEIETLPTGVKIVTINHPGAFEETPQAYLCHMHSHLYRHKDL